MTRTPYRLGGLVALALALSATGLASASSALASSIPVSKIGPHQFFAGVVNGKVQDAIVKVVCPGAANTGHALPGQTISVTQATAVAANFGYTGATGRSIAATVGPPASAGDTLLFTAYNQVAEFPTNIPLPCGGTGLVIFSPVKGGKGAKSATVTVAYANVGAGG